MPNFPECEDCYLRSQVKELESKLKTAEIDRDRYLEYFQSQRDAEAKEIRYSCSDFPPKKEASEGGWV